MLTPKQIKFLKARSSRTVLPFLSINEQITLQHHFTENIQLYGGYQDAEKKRAVLNGDFEKDIICYYISYPQKYLDISHSNILGTLLSKNIPLDHIGDILPTQQVFFCSKEYSTIVEREFTSINNVPIKVAPINPTNIVKEQDYEYMETILSSMRLDLVVSALGNMSRKDATQWIIDGFVKRNQMIELKPSKQIQQEDVISIQKRGRFEILDNNSRTKKDKIIVKYRKFV